MKTVRRLKQTTPFCAWPRPPAVALLAKEPLIERLLDILFDGTVTIIHTLLRDGDFEPGDHLKILYGAYSHHGIYAGKSHVIHLSKQSSRIEKMSLSQFCSETKQIWLVPSPLIFTGAEVVQRAQSKLGETQYDLFSNNCEQFCNWCRSGRCVSKQVERWN